MVLMRSNFFFIFPEVPLRNIWKIVINRKITNKVVTITDLFFIYYTKTLSSAKNHLYWTNNDLSMFLNLTFILLYLPVYPISNYRSDSISTYNLPTFHFYVIMYNLMIKKKFWQNLFGYTATIRYCSTWKTV